MEISAIKGVRGGGGPTLNGNAIKNVHIFWEPFPKQDSFNHINLKL